MVICNFSVTRIVYRSYHSMQITLGSIDSSDSWNRTSSNKLRHRTSELSANTNKSINLITRDELKFVTMINCLTTSFVVCWGCQMVSSLCLLISSTINLFNFFSFTLRTQNQNRDLHFNDIQKYL